VPLAASGSGLAATFVLLQQPALALVLGISVVLVLLAIRSVVFPVALAGLPNVYIALAGSDPFPNKSLAFGLFAWTSLAIAVAATREERELPRRVLLAPPVLLTIVLLVLLVAHATRAPTGGYLSLKLQFFLATNVIGLIAGILIGRRGRRLLLWAVLTLSVSAASAVVLARGLSTGTATTYADRFTLDSNYDPIAFGRDAGRGILLAVWILLAVRSVRARTLALAAVPVLAVAFFASGSRGPVLGLAAGLLVLLPLSLDQPGARKRVLLVALGGIGAALLVSQLVPGGALNRSFSFILGGGGDDSNGRFHLWHVAWDAFRAHPLLGIGTAGFAALGDSERYPHNIVLELLAELGVVGGLIFAGFVGSTVVALVRVYRRGLADDRAQAAAVAALFAAAMVNAMFSGDLPTNGAVWVAAGLAIGLAQRAAVPLAASGRLGWGSRRRLERLRPRRDRQAERPVRPAPQPRRPVSPGAILSPADGAVVSGIVSVAALPATSGWGAASARLEAAPGESEEWQRGAVADEQAIDVFAVDADGVRRHVAIARSQRIADRLAAELAREAAETTRFETERSRRRPWHAGPASFEWDTAALEPGKVRLRLVTVDLTGLRIVSPEVMVRVQRAPAVTAAPAPADEHEAVTEQGLELVLRERVLAQDAAELAERASALDEREAALITAAQQARVRAAELEEREQGLVERLETITARERGMARHAGELAQRASALDEREAAAAAAAAELGARAGELERREQGLVERLEVVAERERELVEQAGELAQRASALDEREAADAAAAGELGARAAELERREQGLVERLEAVTARERELVEQAGELAQRASELDEREAAVAAAAVELGARAAEFERREQGLVERLEAVAARERGMARHAGELAQRASELDEREAAVTAQAAAAEELAVRAAELERREQGLVERLEAVTARERELVEEAGEFAQRASALDEREAAVAVQAAAAEELGARAAEFERREQGLVERLEAVTARERELGEQAGEFAQRASALDEREAAVAVQAAAAEELGARAAELERREHGLVERLEAVAARERGMARHAGELAQRASALDEREAAVTAQAAAAEELAGRAAELERREQGLVERLEAVAARERAIARHAAELAERERSPERERPATVAPPQPPAPTRAEAEPELEPPPAARIAEPPSAPPLPPREPTPVPTRLARVRLWELERFVAEHPHPDPYVREERQALLFHLRDHASVDGSIPERFRPLLEDAFGDLFAG
jgi:O-antigen ligase/uncharacterized protein (DUF3084 family)